MSEAERTRRRGPGRPFPKGTSGNPGGLLKKLKDIQSAVITKWSPKVNEVMGRLLELTRDGDGRVAVAACRAFLEHVAPAPRVDKPAEDGDGDMSKLSDEDFWQRILEAPAVRQVALKVLQGGKT